VGKDIFDRLNRERLQQDKDAIEQQRRKANPILQWAQKCIDDNKINLDRGPYGVAASFNLGTRIVTKYLYKSCVLFCKHEGKHPPDRITFGRICTRMFGPRVPTKDRGKRPPGYYVPERDIWQEKVDDRLGISKLRNKWPRLLPAHSNAKRPLIPTDGGQDSN
jgi:hypothetical protein